MANPDEGSCFANSEGVIAATGAETKTMAGKFFAVSRLFEMWFMCGFILTCSSLAFYIFSFLNFKYCRANLMNELNRAIGYFSVLGTLVWLVLGTVLRWSLPGKTCSGDMVDDKSGQVPYQWSSGRFIKIYLFILFGVVSITLICAIAGAITAAASAAYRRPHAHVLQGDVSSRLLSGE